MPKSSLIARLTPLAVACRLLFVGLAILFANPSDVFAQRWPQQSWWQQNLARVNPASSANEFSLSATGFLRRQYNNLPGAPTTTGVTLASPIYIVNAGGALSVERDEIGAQSVTQFRGSLAYAPIVRENLRVSVGLGASLKNSQLDGSRLRTDDGEYSNGLINHNDNLLPTDRGLGADART